MTHPTTETLPSLRAIAATDVLLVALDFDGTLAPLQNEPMKSRMLPEARVALDSLIALPQTFVALVSGRSLSDLEIISEHTPDSRIFLAGSHGAEFWVPGVGTIEPEDAESEHVLRDQLQAAAEAEVADIDGVWVEPKTFGFGIHTRLADPDDAERAWQIADALVAQRAAHWRRRTGHGIVEYSFRHEGKDAAVAALRERVGATAVLFAGDDTTDEDAMTRLRPGDLGIRVGPGPTAASVRVDDAAALSAALAALAGLRASERE